MVRIALGAVACLFMLSACGERPQAIGPASTPSAARLSPEITKPVEVSRFVAAPCSMIKPTQPIARDLLPGVASENSCTWPARTPQQPEITVTVTRTSGGLEALYRRRDQLPLFEPVEIAGFPAVHIDAEHSVANRGRCTVGVGVADDAVITVTATIADPKTLNYPVPCADADLLATSIITGMTGGSP
jgi:hypothetical protein